MIYTDLYVKDARIDVMSVKMRINALLVWIIPTMILKTVNAQMDSCTLPKGTNVFH